MATIDMTTKAYPGNFGVGFRPTPGESGFISRYFDCTATNLLSANDYKILTVSAPAGGIMESFIDVETAEGAADTIDIGTAVNGTQIKSNADLNTTGVVALTTISLAAGDTSVYINPDANISAAKFTLYFRVLSKN